jgi:hypothetical protein
MMVDHDLRIMVLFLFCRAEASAQSAKLSFGITGLHGDLDTAAIVTALEEMSAHGLSLELRALLLPALPELLPTLSAANLVVCVTLSSALRKLVLAILAILAKARRSCGARPAN